MTDDIREGRDFEYLPEAQGEIAIYSTGDLYYILEGTDDEDIRKAQSCEEWLEARRDKEGNTVGRTLLRTSQGREVNISTVFTGIDYSIVDPTEDRRLLFETMIFANFPEIDRIQERAATVLEALEMHGELSGLALKALIDKGKGRDPILSAKIFYPMFERRHRNKLRPVTHDCDTDDHQGSLQRAREKILPVDTIRKLFK